MPKRHARKYHYGPGGLGTCRYCGAPIRWMQKERGMLVATDAGNSNRPHYESCRQQDLWRRPWA